MPVVERWLKSAALEVQEYVGLIVATFRSVFTPPIYRHDIVEQSVRPGGVGGLGRPTH